jgi:hypothetical protein
VATAKNALLLQLIKFGDLGARIKHFCFTLWQNAMKFSKLAVS